MCVDPGECAACRKGDWIGRADRSEVGVIGRNGGYAEYMVTPVRFVHPLAETLSLETACLCELLAVVLKELKRLERTWGPAVGRRTCAVVGTGPIGHLAARILKQRGHQVTVFDRNKDLLKYFNGSDIATNQDLRELTTFDVIVQATGDPDALHAILHNSEAGSTILLLGLPYSRREFSFEAIVGYDKTIVGSVGSSKEDFDDAIATLPALDAAGFIENILPLTEFEQAWELVRMRKYLKVLLQVGHKL